MKSEFNFRWGKKHKAKLITFSIEHNCDTIDAEFDKWADEVEDPSSELAFIEHLKSKGYEAKQTSRV